MMIPGRSPTSAFSLASRAENPDISRVERARIAELLAPFLHPAGGEPVTLSQAQLGQIAAYLDLLLRWNRRINLTAVRDPEQIVIRHFGESLLAAACLFRPSGRERVLDVGSGAGFPGIPLKIFAPGLALTLIESSQRKAAFLKEAAREITLIDINVFAGRAEQFPGPAAEVVSLRAVERFARVLPIAARLLAPGGRLALFIGRAQVEPAQLLLPRFRWLRPVPVPHSEARVIFIGTKPVES